MIWLVRHASTAWTGSRWCGSSDPPLHTVGRLEAIITAASLKEADPHPPAVLSSPALRARQTASIIARALRVPCSLDPSLREVDFGLAEGLEWVGIQGRWPALAAEILAGERYVDWPGGESAAEARTRIESVSIRLRRLPPGTIVVTHGGVIGGLLKADSDRPVAPSEVTGLRWQNEGWFRDQASTTTLARIHG